MITTVCPVTEAGFVRLIMSMIAVTVRLCQTLPQPPLWGHAHKLLSWNYQHKRSGLCGGGRETNFTSVNTDIRNISNPCCEGHLHAVQSVLPTASEQVFFNQGLQVLVYEILCFEGHMRSLRRSVISVQSSGILYSLVSSDDVLVSTYRKANLY